MKTLPCVRRMSCVVQYVVLYEVRVLKNICNECVNTCTYCTHTVYTTVKISKNVKFDDRRKYFGTGKVDSLEIEKNKYFMSSLCLIHSERW